MDQPWIRHVRSVRPTCTTYSRVRAPSLQVVEVGEGDTPTRSDTTVYT